MVLPKAMEDEQFSFVQGLDCFDTNISQFRLVLRNGVESLILIKTLKKELYFQKQ